VQGSFGTSEHSEASEGFFNGVTFGDWTPLLVKGWLCRGGSHAKQFFTVSNPRTLRNEAVLANNPLLDFLIGSGVMLRVAHCGGIILKWRKDLMMAFCRSSGQG